MGEMKAAGRVCPQLQQHHGCDLPCAIVDIYKRMPRRNDDETLLENQAFVLSPIFHLYRVFLPSVQMRVFVPGGEDRTQTRPVRPHLYWGVI
jgi:hypothetical protein